MKVGKILNSSSVKKKEKKKKKAGRVHRCNIEAIYYTTSRERVSLFPLFSFFFKNSRKKTCTRIIILITAKSNKFYKYSTIYRVNFFFFFFSTINKYPDDYPIHDETINRNILHLVPFSKRIEEIRAFFSKAKNASQ